MVFTPAYQRLWNPSILDHESDEPMEQMEVADEQMMIDEEEPMAMGIGFVNQPTNEAFNFQPIGYQTPVMDPEVIQTDEEVIIEHLTKFLSTRDLRTCRCLSSDWNNAIRNIPKFQKSVNVKFQDTLHKELMKRVIEGRPSALQWNSVKLHRFTYQRNCEMFKNYWHYASATLDTLTLSYCSLEYDAFEFVFDHCPVLRTLNLIGCKLYDLEKQDEAKRSRLGSIGPEPHPISRGLKNLNFESMYKIEDSCFDYLMARTGKLESLSLSKCFFPTSEKESFQFLINSLFLISVNIDTIRKLEFNANNYQNEMFDKLTDILMRTMDVAELSLTLTQPGENNYEEIVNFMNKCQGVEKLSLKFLGSVDNASLQALLMSSAATIKKFELDIVGNLISRELPLNLDFLGGFVQLEEFKIKDSKNLRPSDTRKVLGGQRRKDCPEWRKRESRRKIGSMDYRPEMLTGLATRVQSNFIQNLSPNANLRKLTFDKYITLDNFLIEFGQNILSFRNLTKLEVRGPWIHSMDGVVQLIIQNLLELETLVLNDCALDDTHLTGLTEANIHDINLRMTYEYADFTTMQDLLRAIELGIGYVSDGTPRLRLSQLPKLKYLDLSMNPKLTNVSLIDALKIPGLKVLNLNSCFQMRDTSLRFIPLLMPNLEHLHVKHCREMTKGGLNQLVRTSPKLRKVYTTKTVQNRVLAADHDIVLSPNYNDTVVWTHGRAGLQIEAGDE